MKEMVKALSMMPYLTDPDKDSVWQILESGKSVVVGDRDGYNVLIKYVIRLSDGVLWFYKASDLTRLTCEEVVNTTIDGLYDCIWDHYLSHKDVVKVDVDGLLDDMDTYYGTWTVDRLEAMLRKGSAMLVLDNKPEHIIAM